MSFLMKKSIILKTDNSAVFNLGKIQKTFCVINAENISKLLDCVSLAANPRESKKNKVTVSIMDTLNTAPEEMVNRTKGVLVSTQKCESLERGRFRLSFEDEKTDGVLDGGHTLLAIGTFLLEKYHEAQSNRVPSDVQTIKCWKDFTEVWPKHSHLLENFVKEQSFSIPMEIISPTKNIDVDFADLVSEISYARNNNTPLTAGTKADNQGYYDILKANIDPNVVNLIAWKDNEAGKYIKREDIVALALIPFIALQKRGMLDKINSINPSVIYNSKSQCVDIYSKIIEEYQDEQGNLPEVMNNALGLMKDIPKFYDLVYKRFPDAYNDAFPGGFGKITTVTVCNNSKKFSTKFYQHESSYKYPDGYILPFVCAFHELIIIDGNNGVRWATNIEELINDSSKYKMLIGTIKDNYYNPQKVGKSSAAYAGCEMMMKLVLMGVN